MVHGVDKSTAFGKDQGRNPSKREQKAAVGKQQATQTPASLESHKEAAQHLKSLFDRPSGVGTTVLPRPNPRIPAGYTYLGQLITHDLTFHDTRDTSFDRRGGLKTLVNNKILDLDCIYGGGPSVSPWLYELNPSGAKWPRYQFGLDSTNKKSPVLEDIRRVKCLGTAGFVEQVEFFDPLIADPRNDDNLILSQMVVLFYKFHNKVAESIVIKKTADKGEPLEKSDFNDAFDEARNIVVFCFNRIVVCDFLEKMTNDSIYTKVLQFYLENKPLPFADRLSSDRDLWLHVLRVGHVMVRADYDYNSIFSTEGAGGIAGLDNLLGRAGPSITSVPILDSWIIDWSRFFFHTDGHSAPRKNAEGKSINYSHRLWPSMAGQLQISFKTDDGGNGLTYIDVMRGHEASVPNGQTLARRYGLVPLHSDQISMWLDASSIDPTTRKQLSEDTPLFFYLLCEASAEPNEGRCLGPLGSTMLSELVIGSLCESEFDPDDSNIKSLLGGPVPSTMLDIIKIVESK